MKTKMATKVRKPCVVSSLIGFMLVSVHTFGKERTRRRSKKMQVSELSFRFEDDEEEKNSSSDFRESNVSRW